MKLTIKNNIKKFRSKDYNYNFNLTNGHFQRWGKKEEDDPQFSPFSSEILDMEIAINGCPKGEKSSMICKFCYKGNTAGQGEYMTFETFKTILDKFPKIDGHYFLTQIAFGITSFNVNPDFFKIADYCRANNVIPNVTISGRDTLSDEQVDRLSKTLGACAFSVYPEDKDQCYNLINRFIHRGMKQVNIHFFICEETYNFAFEISNDMKNDPRLKGLNAIVFLGLKPKGRAKDKYSVLSLDKYDKLVKHCMDIGIAWGFDSCSSPKAEYSIENSKCMPKVMKDHILSCCERCESGLFSYYIDVSGNEWPCSFCENMMGEFKGIDFLKVKDFNEAWQSDSMANWRNGLLVLKRQCPVYEDIRIKE